MHQPPIAENDATAAELAVKVHALLCQPEILADLPEGDKDLRELTDFIDLTEAPEDASRT